MSDNSPKEIGQGVAPANGDMLRYNSTTQKWEAVTYASVLAAILASDEFEAAVTALLPP